MAKKRPKPSEVFSTDLCAKCKNASCMIRLGGISIPCANLRDAEH